MENSRNSNNLGTKNAEETQKIISNADSILKGFKPKHESKR